ncbi:MAG TPA: carbamoyltransferase HypF, partial [Geobacteraceae bacterium]
LAAITAVVRQEIPVRGECGFAILESSSGNGSLQVSPDCDVCPDCLGELFDPTDRRFRYPFINCTNCGPRYSIITATPYDRRHTTMAGFAMCPDCRQEYEDPADRRFHAQPNACPVCGPRLALTDARGQAVIGEPLATAIELLREGRIVAVKGLGGYHLAVDATNDRAVGELRYRKQRDEKPFALMTASLAEAARFVRLSDLEERFLRGPERPIVLLRKAADHRLSPRLAPANDYFGVMLPSTPLHHLLLRDNFPALVMTSGNISDEPIAYREEEALSRLGGIADAFLSHDRPIHTRTDDSVIRVFQGHPLMLRRSRGYVPRSVQLAQPQRAVLAVGGELKGTVCLTRGDQAFLSQHVGDLKNSATLRSLAEIIDHLQQLLGVAPVVVAHDLHPDYLSTVHAAAIAELPKVVVQHHHAHMAACMAENRLEGEAIGVVFDGTGHGLDGTVWGGEFLVGNYRDVQRRGFLRPVPMPGGDAAAREPFRMAIATLREQYGEGVFNLPLPCLADIPPHDRKLFLRMLERGINSPLTSSCGRLFDTVAAILGVRRRTSYEGQAAIELEGVAELGRPGEPYPLLLEERGEATVLDFLPMVVDIVDDMLAGRPVADIAATFHDSLARGALAMCQKIRGETGLAQVVLSGGVFQNKLFSEALTTLLAEAGFAVHCHRLVPPNDGGLALGQAVIAGRSYLCA